jgi:hypothetical protein
MAALSAQTTQASGRVPGGPLVGLSVGITVGRTSCDLRHWQWASRSGGRLVTLRHWQWRTPAWRPSCERRPTSCVARARGSSPQPRPSVTGSSGSCTTGPRTGSWRSRFDSALSGIGSSTPEVELAVYLCCLEAMQNAAKHAGRDARVTVRLSRDEDELTFSVEDDGCGFEPASAEGSGRAGPEDRIVPLGGRLEVSSTRGHGKTVAGAVPWLRRTRNTALSAPAQPAVV